MHDASDSPRVGSTGRPASTAGESERPVALTVTPNPSLDLLFDAERLVWDDANRLPMPRRRPGGQGVNVVRAIRALGGRAVAVAPLGGETGRELRSLLDAEGTPLRAVPSTGETRVFVAVRERESGRSLLLNPRGTTVESGLTDELLAATGAALERRRPGWVAGCGSLPPGVGHHFYVEAGRLARRCGARWVPDCDGPALRAAADAGCDLLVPNVHEAGRLLGRPIEDLRGAAAAARALLEYGPPVACVTMGEGGAVAADATSGVVWHAVAAGDRPDGCAVGAGDAFLGALLLALDAHSPAPDALRRAVAAGTAVLYGEGDSLVDAATVARIESTVTVRRVT
ncbi:MAG: 1-phosphofructokinase family hexose kinase [Gemmatimonadota bacterium]